MLLLMVVLHTAIIYVFLVVGLARFGRPHMASLTPIAYLVIALLGSSVEMALYVGSTGLGAGLVSAATLVAMDYFICRSMNRWPRLRRWLVGEPVVLIHEGKLLEPHLRQARLTEEDLKAAVRMRGYDNLDDIWLAVMEPSGAIGVVPRRPHR